MALVCDMTLLLFRAQEGGGIDKQLSNGATPIYLAGNCRNKVMCSK